MKNKNIISMDLEEKIKRGLLSKDELVEILKNENQDFYLNLIKLGYGAAPSYYDWKKKELHFNLYWNDIYDADFHRQECSIILT
jgi:hypothetical protein